MPSLRFALRQLALRPGFSAVAILTLALGLAANATILGVVHQLFFQPLPVHDSERLVMLLRKSPAWPFPHGQSWPDFLDYRKQTSAFEDVLATFLNPAHLAVPGHDAERLWIEAVSANYFSLLGVRPALGSTFPDTDPEVSSPQPTVLLSHAWWTRRFGADPSVVGKTVHVNGRPFTVTGVMPRDFFGAQWGMAPSLWIAAPHVPNLLGSDASFLRNRGATAFKVMARLKPGISLPAARAAAEVVFRRLSSAYPSENRGASLLVLPEIRCRPEPTFSEIIPFAAAIFLALVLVVLLIACANVANLMLARSLHRFREMAIRSALGASRRQLIAQLLVESLVLAVLAAVVGNALAFGLGPLLERAVPSGDIPLQIRPTWNGTVAVLTLVIAIAAGLLTGLLPALRATRLNLQSTLRNGAGSQTGPARHPLRDALVVAQLALCLAVLVGGGLFVDSLRRTARLDLGFRPDHLALASVDPELQGYSDDRGRRFVDDALQRLRALPGVESASAARTIPFEYGVVLTEVGAQGKVSLKASPNSSTDGFLRGVAYNTVEPDFLRTLGIPLLRGRGFQASDRPGSPPVAIVNQTLARQLWGDEDPVGRRLHFGRSPDTCTVVGVVRDGKYVMMNEEPRPYLYLPMAQRFQTPVMFQVRTKGSPLSVASAIRGVVANLDPTLPVYAVRTMDEHLQSSALALMPLRAAALLASIQGVVALVLAIMGLYAVVACGVSRRTREIGVRVALGAQPAQVLRLVLRDGIRLTLSGIACGTALALILALALSRLLHGVSPFDVAVYALVGALLAAVALVACYLPARRALRIDPLVALRAE